MHFMQARTHHGAPPLSTGVPLEPKKRAKRENPFKGPRPSLGDRSARGPNNATPDTMPRTASTVKGSSSADHAEGESVDADKPQGGNSARKGTPQKAPSAAKEGNLTARKTIPTAETTATRRDAGAAALRGSLGGPASVSMALKSARGSSKEEKREGAVTGAPVRRAGKDVKRPTPLIVTKPVEEREPERKLRPPRIDHADAKQMVREFKLRDEERPPALMDKQESRHVQAPSLDGVGAGMLLLFNCNKARFKLVIGDTSTLPEKYEYSLFARNGATLGKVKIPAKKGLPFEERVSFEHRWLPGVDYGLVHHFRQGPGTLELELEWEIEVDEAAPPVKGGAVALRGAPQFRPGHVQRAVLLVSPWLAYACCVGARLNLIAPGDYCGRVSTVQRVLRDDTVVVRVDATTEEKIVDPRPDRCVPTSTVRYPKATPILYLHNDECVDACVVEMPKKEWEETSERRKDDNGGNRPDLKSGNRHWVEMTVKDKVSIVAADLNEYNHCQPRFETVAEYEEQRVQHCLDMVARNEKVEDAITGNTLAIKDQLVNVDVKASTVGGATNTLLGKPVKNVQALVSILTMPSPKRGSGEHPSQACLVRAGPGTGKTWMCKQAVYILGETLAKGSEHKGMKLCPIVLYVQQIVYLLRDATAGSSEGVHALFGSYVDAVHRRVAEMLKQAFQLRALIVILDGVDEAAGLRRMVESFVLDVLVPSGNRVLITSRVEGIGNMDPYLDRHFSVLDLKELSNEQQRSVIGTQMRGSEFFDHLLALGEMRRGLDRAYQKLSEGVRSELEALYLPVRAENPETSETIYEPIPSSAKTPVSVRHSKEKVTMPRERRWAVFEMLLRHALAEAVAGSAEKDAGAAGSVEIVRGQKDDPEVLHCRVIFEKGKTLVWFVARLVGNLAEEGAPEAALADSSVQGPAAHGPIDPREVRIESEPHAVLTMTELQNGFISLDPTHFRSFKATMLLTYGLTEVECRCELHYKEIFAVGSSGHTNASEHYHFFRQQMEGKLEPDRIDALLEPALLFLVDASGIPVLLSLLVLIFTSGGEDLAELPTNQFELYEMGIMHAIDRRFFTAYTAVTGVRGGGNSAEGIVYDDALATRTLVQIWQQLFALDRTKALAVQSSLDSEKRERKQSRKKSLDQGEGITTGDMAVHKSVEQGQHRGDNELYDIFREAAKYLNMARHGAARTVLNACELAMPKQLRSIIMALAESNLKLIRDGGSIHNTGLVMLRHVAVVNQQQGRRQFGARDVARALLKEMPFSEALTLWLHLNNEEGGIPLMKTLEAQTDEAEAQYQFKHLSFQEGLFAQFLFLKARDGQWDGWSTDVRAASFVNDPFMNNTCRISARKLGDLLALQRHDWDFATEPEARLTPGGKRALWLLTSSHLRSLDLSSNKVGEENDESDAGLSTLLTIGTSLRTLKLRSNLIGKMDWKKQQLTRALSNNETLTELDLSNNGLGDKGMKAVCTALATCKSLIKLDLSFNQPGRCKELPGLLRQHPTLTDIGIEEKDGFGKLDNRAKEAIGRVLLHRPTPLLIALKVDLFNLTSSATSLQWPANADRSDATMLAGLLRANSTLTELNFEGEGLQDDDRQTLGKALLSSPHGRLGLCSNFGLKAYLKEITFDLKNREQVRSTRSWCLLAGLLKANRTLVSLTLQSLGPEHVDVLAIALRANKTLKNLYLEKMDTQDPSRARKIKLDLQSLNGSTKVSRVDLCPSLKSDGTSSATEFLRELLDKAMCTFVAELISENEEIESLRLNPGQGAEGGKVLELMQACKTSSLRTLDLNGVNLGARGSPQLFDHVLSGVCPNLTKLCLASNNLVDSKLDNMVAALNSPHCTLSALDLSSNEISGVLLFRSLAQNRSLTSVDLRNNPITDDQMERIGAFLLTDKCQAKLKYVSVTLPAGAQQEAKTLEITEEVGVLDLISTRHDPTSRQSSLEPGAMVLLFGLLRHNGAMRELRLAVRPRLACNRSPRRLVSSSPQVR
jgi:Ran GTPase-activating protein (RanGAP) involved in mRNA processing and transport